MDWSTVAGLAIVGVMGLFVWRTVKKAAKTDQLEDTREAAREADEIRREVDGMDELDLNDELRRPR